MDTFERNLESVEQELGIDPSRAVPVLYKSQLEMSNFFSILPTLLLIGFLVFSMRRAGSLMGGLGGPGKGGKGGGLFGGMMQVGSLFFGIKGVIPRKLLVNRKKYTRLFKKELFFTI